MARLFLAVSVGLIVGCCVQGWMKIKGRAALKNPQNLISTDAGRASEALPEKISLQNFHTSSWLFMAGTTKVACTALCGNAK